jgi:hypothetical protein
LNAALDSGDGARVSYDESEEANIAACGSGGQAAATPNDALLPHVGRVERDDHLAALDEHPFCRGRGEALRDDDVAALELRDIVARRGRDGRERAKEEREHGKNASVLGRARSLG